DRLDEATGLCLTGTGELDRGAVVDRGADHGQAERDVDTPAEARVLEHGQALIVIHRKRAIGPGEPIRNEQRIRWQRSGEPQAFRAQFIEDGPDHFDLLSPEVAALAAMRIETGDQDPRRGDSEAADKLRVQDPDGVFE